MRKQSIHYSKSFKKNVVKLGFNRKNVSEHTNWAQLIEKMPVSAQEGLIKTLDSFK